jgi:HEAT repeat protein
MSEIDKIVAMLRADALEKRIAAAMVLGELRPKAPNVLDALTELATSDVAALQIHALDALGRIGAKRVVTKLLPLLGARDADVRQRASRAIAGVGADVLPAVRKRMESAGSEERRALDAILAELGGKEAFGTLLASLTSSDADAAKSAALAVRAHLKSADKAERKTCLAQTEAFLKAQTKSGGNASAVAAAVKILGYIEDERAVPTLLVYATDSKQPSAVRQEAIIALRFVLGAAGDARKKAVAALIDCAVDRDETVAQTALLSLGPVPVDASHGAKLAKLVEHPDFERARLVLEKLGQQHDADAAKLLVGVLARSEKRRAEVAARLLASHPDAAVPLARALLETRDADRRWTIRTVLRPLASRLTPAVRKQLLEAAIEQLESGQKGWEACLDVAQASDAKGTAEALRTSATRMRKKNPDKALAALSVISKSEFATDDDRWSRAVLELLRSPRELSPAARATDDALRQIAALAEEGFDVVTQLRKDRSLDPEQLYYVGFHFAEKRDPIGAELLRVVIDKSGRTKLGKMAKNKLGLSER